MGKPFKIEKAEALLDNIKTLEIGIMHANTAINTYEELKMQNGTLTSEQQKDQLIIFEQRDSMKNKMRELVGVASGDTVRVSEIMGIMIKILEEVIA